MAKIDLAAITKGLQKVQDKATAMETVAHDELVDADLIYFAENNPYAEQDTPEELAALAEDIKVNGLIHPLVVHRESPEHYTLISGEKRYKSIRDYLKWQRIPCRVYSGLSPDRAQLMLHSANLSTREYTTEQKLRFYLDADALLRRMQESGEYSGPLQKGLAALLNVSDRQVRRYKSITEKLTPEQKAEVASGDMSMRGALELISSAKQQSQPKTQQEPEQPVTPIVLPWDSTEETDSSQTESAEEPEEPIREEEPEESDEELYGKNGERLLTDKELHSASWTPWLDDLVHTAYNCEMLSSASTCIGYNLYSALSFLPASLSENLSFDTIDVMQEFAPIYGEWSDYYEDYKWQSLSTCAAYYGCTFLEYDSLEDARVTLFCYRQMQNRS